MSVAARELPLPGAEILDPQRYACDGYPHEDWARLRQESPVHWCPREKGESFWAVTRHADIVDISRQPDRFLNGPRLVLNYDEDLEDGEFPVRMLLNMDPPEHHSYRELVSRRFTPRALQKITGQVDGIANEILDQLITGGVEAETDFVADVSGKLPIWVIAQMLGVPRKDWELLFHWTNRTIGAADPEYCEEGKTPDETRQAAQIALFEYFNAMTEDRRKNPKDDLVSVLSNSRIGGEHLPPFELLSFYLLLVVAGNETTRNATSGGLLALIEHPEQFEKARQNPKLLKPLVEEILRWTSPVIHFCRTPIEDCEINGQSIKAGDRMVLFYPSANRDADVFESPDDFRIDRSPNRHIAFGIGEHFCLGAHVARLELQVIFRHLVERFEHVELAGPIDRLRSSVVGGIKHMPIHYRLRSAR